MYLRPWMLSASACRLQKSNHTGNTPQLLEKFETNKKRDSSVKEELEKLGWHACVIWECRTSNHDSLMSELEDCLLHVFKLI
jgi:G:T-mismatch repair DNA endonuclease (very short patch repair protein)